MEVEEGESAKEKEVNLTMRSRACWRVETTLALCVFFSRAATVRAIAYEHVMSISISKIY